MSADSLRLLHPTWQAPTERAVPTGRCCLPTRADAAQALIPCDVQISICSCSCDRRSAISCPRREAHSPRWRPARPAPRGRSTPGRRRSDRRSTLGRWPARSPGRWPAVRMAMGGSRTQPTSSSPSRSCASFVATLSRATSPRRVRHPDHTPGRTPRSEISDWRFPFAPIPEGGAPGCWRAPWAAIAGADGRSSAFGQAGCGPSVGGEGGLLRAARSVERLLEIGDRADDLVESAALATGIREPLTRKEAARLVLVAAARLPALEESIVDRGRHLDLYRQARRRR